ncbi:MAG: hypothetical protein AAFO07_11760, partial [Bacteroidota bacterium]
SRGRNNLFTFNCCIIKDFLNQNICGKRTMVYKYKLPEQFFTLEELEEKKAIKRSAFFGFLLFIQQTSNLINT